MPRAILECNRENIHDAMVQCLTRAFGIEFLWIIATRANHVMRVVRCFDQNGLDLFEVGNFLTHSKRQINQCL